MGFNSAFKGLKAYMFLFRLLPVAWKNI